MGCVGAGGLAGGVCLGGAVCRAGWASGLVCLGGGGRRARWVSRWGVYVHVMALCLAGLVCTGRGWGVCMGHGGCPVGVREGHVRNPRCGGGDCALAHDDSTFLRHVSRRQQLPDNTRNVPAPAPDVKSQHFHSALPLLTPKSMPYA